MTPLQSWTSTVAFWSTVAQAPSRVARAQTAATLRMMRTANLWKVAQRTPKSEAPAFAPTPDPVPVAVEPAQTRAAEPATIEAPEPRPAEPAAVEAAAITPAEPAEVEAVPAEDMPHEALTHASPTAIAAGTAEMLEALPAEEPAPAPVEPTEAEGPVLAVLAQPEAAPSPLQHLDLLPESILVEAAEPALAKTAAAAVRSASSRVPSGGARTRKPGRG